MEEQRDRQKLCRCDASVFRLLGAIVCVAISIATWVTMAEKLQDLNNNYKKPYFITYWIRSFYSTPYVVWKLWRVLLGGRDMKCNYIGDGLLTNTKVLLIASGILAAVGLVSAYTWYISLTQTSVPANTAIYQSASAFVFVLSVPILRERVTVLKVLSVLFSMCGVALVAFFSNSDCTPHIPIDNATNATNDFYTAFQPVHISHIHRGGCSEKSTPLGYILLIIAVVTYSFYEVMFKRFGAKKNDPASVPNGARFLGYLGVFSLLFGWPPLIILHYSKVEPFELPNLHYLGLLTLNAFLDVSFNAALLIGIALSSPLFMTVGTVLAVPSSVLVDWIVHGYVLPWPAFVGIGVILVSFVGFTVSEYVAGRREAKHKKMESLKLNATTSDVASENGSINEPHETHPLLGDRRARSTWGKVWYFTV